MVKGQASETQAVSHAMLCIFCLQDRESSVEHVFPEAIGGTFTINRLCGPCNSHLGSHVDSHLANHWYVRTLRSSYGLRGKNGTPPSPTVFASVDGADGLQVELFLDGSAPVRIVNPVVAENGDKVVYWRSGEERAAKRILEKIGRRRGIDSALDLSSPTKTIHKPKISGSIELDCHDYRRSMMKIAYQLAHRWLGDEYLSDPFAAALRELLLLKHYDLADFENAPFGAQIFIGGPIFPNTKSLHFAHLYLIESQLFVVLSIFGAFRGYIEVASAPPQTGLPLPCAVAVDIVTGAYLEGGLDELAQLLSGRAQATPEG